MTYYQSEKVLGKLYRAIDERLFLIDLRARSRVFTPDRDSGTSDILLFIWIYIKEWTTSIHGEYHLECARHLREM